MIQKIAAAIIPYTPPFWTMLGKFDAEWDAHLNALLDTAPIVYLERNNPRIASLDGILDIWIENYPYGYGTDWKKDRALTIDGLHKGIPIAEYPAAPRPSRRTIYRLKKYIDFEIAAGRAQYYRRYAAIKTKGTTR